MKISLIQMDIQLGQKQANLEHAAALMHEALASQPDLIVLPELFGSGYAYAKLAEMAEVEGDMTLSWLKEIARRAGIHVVAGSVVEKDKGRYYNTSYALGRKGEILAKYRKVHLFCPVGEDKHFTPGSEPVAFSTEFGQVGILICFDVRFPELSSALARSGCRLLVVPAEFPAIRQEAWRILLQARAVENQIFVAGVNRVGRSEEADYSGHSMVVGPSGEILSEGSEDEEVITVELDFSRIDMARANFDCLKERRPEVYGKNVNPAS